MGQILEYLLNYEHVVKFSTSSDVQLERIIQSYKNDAGFDLFVSKDAVIRAGHAMDVSTGIYIEPGEQIYFTIMGRSSSFRNKGILVSLNLIDTGFRGELFAVAYNFTNITVTVKAGERICQIVPHRLIPVKFEKVQKIGESPRGRLGFGSSGI